MASLRSPFAYRAQSIRVDRLAHFARHIAYQQPLRKSHRRVQALTPLELRKACARYRKPGGEATASCCGLERELL